MPMNDGIVNLLITVTLQDTSSPHPLTPRFTVLADSQQTGAGQQRFSCGGVGDNDEDLLKDILRKIIASYPTRPISLCISGAQILADAQCVAAAPAAGLGTLDGAGAAAPMARSMAMAAAPKKAAPKKAAPKKAAPKKAAPKEAAPKKAAPKKAARNKATPKRISSKSDKAAKGSAKKHVTKKGAAKKTSPKAASNKRQPAKAKARRKSSKK